MSSWKECKLGEVAEVQTGPFGSQLKNEQYIIGGTPVVTVEHINNFRVANFNYPSVTDEDKNRLQKYSLKSGDIVFTRVGSVDLSAYVSEHQDGWLFSSRMLRVRPNKEIDARFLSYFFQQRSFRNSLIRIAVGATMPSINTEILKYVGISYPPLDEQKAIANILSSLDNKIELLKEQNKTLETMAQTIFKEWFVNFNYSDATSEMVESEMGKIPKGWRVYKLEELVNTINGYSYKGDELVDKSTEALVTLKSFNRNGGFQTRGFKPFKGFPKAEQEVLIGDLIVAHTDLTQDAEVLGNPAFVFENGGFEKMYITMDLVKVISKVEEIKNSFLYYVMRDRRFKGHCVGYSNGTTVLHLSKKAIPEYKIALPVDLNLANRFSKLADSFTNKISHNIIQIQRLTEAKDSLLPRLMNGSNKVNGFGG